MSGSAATRAGSGAKRSGAPAHFIHYFATQCVNCRSRDEYCVFICRPDPGPLVSGRVVRQSLLRDDGSGGRVPEFHPAKATGTENGTRKYLKSQANCAKFQSSSENPSRVRRLPVRIGARVTEFVSGTLELWNYTNIPYGYHMVMSSSAVPPRFPSAGTLELCLASGQPRHGQAIGRIKQWAGYSPSGAFEADPVLNRGTAPQNFRAPPRLADFAPDQRLSLGAPGRVGTASLERGGIAFVNQRVEARCRKLVRLPATPLRAISAAKGWHPPHADRRWGFPHAAADFLDFGHPLSVRAPGDRKRAALLSRRKGSGESGALASTCRWRETPRQWLRAKRVGDGGASCRSRGSEFLKLTGGCARVNR